MLSVLPFALLDCSAFLSNLHPCERRCPCSGVRSGVLPPQPPSFVLMGILRAIALERDLQCLGLQPQLYPEKSLQMYG